MLGAFLRLLKEGKVIITKNQTQMLRFFANHFSTNKKGEVSKNNLRLCYYEYDKKVLQELGDSLYHLLSELKRME